MMQQAIEERGDGGGVTSSWPQSSTGRFDVRSVDVRS
jgi:hypothetical protein